MIDRRKPTPEELQDVYEKLYKMYNIKNRADYEGSIAKYECTINNERGLFKERISTQSKDHIMEQVTYELATILGVPCCKSSCRKSKDLYGSFSRYEVKDLENVVTFSKLAGKSEMFSDELLEYTLNICNGTNNFVIRLYQYVIFDFILGQLDRHLDNLSVYKYNGKTIWYPLYDNGLCCFASYGNDNAILSLEKGFYASRMGSDTEILESIEKYRSIIYPGDFRNLLKYKDVSKNMLYNIIDKSDKYNQIGKNRREATVNFIYNQLTDIHKLNLGR